ncbi:Kelch repeat-containing protein [Geodermatophilus sp. SYSU D00703]
MPRDRRCRRPHPAGSPGRGSPCVVARSRPVRRRPCRAHGRPDGRQGPGGHRPWAGHVARGGGAMSGWSATGPTGTGRSGHSASLLPNGTVPVAGGDAGGQQTATCEVYDPATGTWSVGAPLLTPRTAHTALSLPGGRVLVLGGYAEDVFVPTLELFDPATGTGTSPGATAPPREHPAAVLLGSGAVLVTGGYDRQAQTDLASCASFDPVGGTWSGVAAMAPPSLQPRRHAAHRRAGARGRRRFGHRGAVHPLIHGRRSRERRRPRSAARCGASDEVPVVRRWARPPSGCGCGSGQPGCPGPWSWRW